MAPREYVSKEGSPGSTDGTEEEPPSCPVAPTENQQRGTSGSSSTSGARHQRREDTRRRRHDRRAAPYGVGGRRGRGEEPSSELGAGRRRTGPTTGETQVEIDKRDTISCRRCIQLLRGAHAPIVVRQKSAPKSDLDLMRYMTSRLRECHWFWFQ